MARACDPRHFDSQWRNHVTKCCHFQINVAMEVFAFLGFPLKLYYIVVRYLYSVSHSQTEAQKRFGCILSTTRLLEKERISFGRLNTETPLACHLHRLCQNQDFSIASRYDNPANNRAKQIPLLTLDSKVAVTAKVDNRYSQATVTVTVRCYYCCPFIDTPRE